MICNLQVFLTSANYLDDASTSAPYSKFAHEKPATIPVSGKTAMLMIYVPSALFLLNYLRPFLALPHTNVAYGVTALQVTVRHGYFLHRKEI